MFYPFPEVALCDLFYQQTFKRLALQFNNGANDSPIDCMHFGKFFNVKRVSFTQFQRSHFL